MTKSELFSSARVFFALWPTEAERAALANWQPPLHELCGGRTMRADTLHATLIFLGEIAEHRLEALQLAAQEVAGASFELRLDKVRYWGHNHIAYAAPSVVPAPLSALVQDLEQRLRAHRFRFERREYKPHVTLLRHGRWTDAPLPEMNAVNWQVQDFALVSSQPDEQGARYEVLARFPLLRSQVI
ncbi:MAG TPA: RNA 2',3'-cyclic phosphodiesterase [Gallionella sp.]|nr:RNA 2',3'-cyclic phosphodiesterase [Gallionella sp.]